MLHVRIKYHFNKILHGEYMRKIFFAMCIVQAIYASAFEQAAPHPEDSHLVKALRVLGESVTISEKDGKLSLEGTPEAVQGELHPVC